MSTAVSQSRADSYQRHRRELVNYATRLVLRHGVAEEIVQEAALRLLSEPQLPDDDAQVRAWLFRVVSNLAIDHLRRHSTWREIVLQDTRKKAEADPVFVAESVALRGRARPLAPADAHAR